MPGVFSKAHCSLHRGSLGGLATPPAARAGIGADARQSATSRPTKALLRINWRNITSYSTAWTTSASGRVCLKR